MARTPAELHPVARRIHRWCRVVVLLLLRWTRPRSTRWDGAPTELTFVIHNAFGVGGTIRSTFTQVNWFASQGVPVRLLSITHATTPRPPFFALHPAVRLEVLDPPPAERSAVDRVLHRLLWRVPGLLFHPDETRIERMSAWRDLQLIRGLRRIRTGRVVGTRAGINDAMTRVCRPGLILVGQEHVPLASYTASLRAELQRSYPLLDALMVLTEADAVQARALLDDAPTRVEVVPNALPDVRAPRADLGSRRIATAGRLSRGKRQDLLVRAFAALADDHPDWQLVIHGSGPREQRLTRLVEQLGLSDRVELPGATDRLPEELARSSIFALTSDFEAFGIVLIEAMRAGMAVVSTDCRHGPPEIIDHEVDGLLVTEGDVEAIGAGLRRLIEDEPLRRRLGEAAAASSQRYTADVVAQRWSEVHRAAAQVRSSRGGRSARPGGGGGRHGRTQ